MGDIRGKLEDARETLFYAGKYMAGLGKAIEELNRRKLSDRQVYEYIDALFPLTDGVAGIQKKNLLRMKEELKTRYFDALIYSMWGRTATALSTPSATLPPTPTPSAGRNTTMKTCSCAPSRATP